MTLFIITLSVSVICAAVADNHYRNERILGIIVWGVSSAVWFGIAATILKGLLP